MQAAVTEGSARPGYTRSRRGGRSGPRAVTWETVAGVFWMPSGGAGRRWGSRREWEPVHGPDGPGGKMGPANSGCANREAEWELTRVPDWLSYSADNAWCPAPQWSTSSSAPGFPPPPPLKPWDWNSRCRSLGRLREPASANHIAGKNDSSRERSPGDATEPNPFNPCFRAGRAGGACLRMRGLARDGLRAARRGGRRDSPLGGRR